MSVFDGVKILSLAKRCKAVRNRASSYNRATSSNDLSLCAYSPKPNCSSFCSTVLCRLRYLPWSVVLLCNLLRGLQHLVTRSRGYFAVKVCPRSKHRGIEKCVAKFASCATVKHRHSLMGNVFHRRTNARKCGSVLAPSSPLAKLRIAL